MFLPDSLTNDTQNTGRSFYFMKPSVAPKA